jgi:hypothetical protein
MINLIKITKRLDRELTIRPRTLRGPTAVHADRRRCDSLLLFEVGEACDDGNAWVCGPCDPTCVGGGIGTCPAASGCNAGAVSTSAMCVDELC